MTDLSIAQSVEMDHIRNVAAKLNIQEDDLEMYGKYKAKLPLRLIDPAKVKQNKLILVTARSRPAGSGRRRSGVLLQNQRLRRNRANIPTAMATIAARTTK